MDIKIDNIEDEKETQVQKIFKWKKFFSIILSIIFCLFLIIIYCRFKATTGLKVYEYKVTDSSLPDSFHGVKVVQFSDLYYGNTVDIKYLKEIVSSINKLKPDIVVFTGDLISINVDDETKNQIIESLGSINSSIGKYAIKGDSDNDLFDGIINSSGFINLTNTSVNAFYKGDIPINISNQDIQSDLFNILLIHEPDSIDSFENKFNLVLSGHSLNGQINIPIIKKLFLKNGSKKYYNGYYDINGSPLYVSNGIGTTNFKYRLFNKPSVSLYRLTKY
ncbi:MAG: metallophosphoesterase [Bacilli bacterium]